MFPLVPIYYTVTYLRNKLYDLGIKKSISYNFPVICVGNLSTGGTGKTPMIEYLIELLLKDGYNIATLSRGYRRKSKGFQLANEKSTAQSIGDEPFQFYSKFKNRVHVAVDVDRQNGIKKIRDLDNKPNVILLDDAFQHRKVKAGLNVLLTTFNNLYTNDFVLPTGNLREPKSGANRANIIVVTKCPNSLSLEQKNNIIKTIKAKDSQSVFFSNILYSDVIISGEEKRKVSDLLSFTLVTGIANSQPLVTFLNDKNLNFEHLNFKDHHEFSQEDVNELQKKELIITTEKDFMRLKPYKSLKNKLFYLPIKVHIDDDLKFNKTIRDFCLD